MKPIEDALYESEVSLRMVDRAIEELGATGAPLDPGMQGFLEHVLGQQGGFAELSRTLLRAYAETVTIAARVTGSRGILESSSVETLRQMRGRLDEVQAATENATNNILNRLGRAIALADGIDAHADAPAEERAAFTASLREEVHAAISHLQFQDITAQEIRHLSDAVLDMHQRLSELVEVFRPCSVMFEPATRGVVAASAAGERAAGENQAVADEIFAQRRTRRTA